ncbi:hypothetical protein [Ereboglobus luteus]|uniref:hypothetical protein n=1 Tax=Ereboglobus luteus TaxID=1796921 RepID=UPI0012603293|nr:hypothetical protein [Ereboglobus luteus]
MLTNTAQTVLEDFVSPLFRIASIFLLAIWMPATMHCGIEAISLSTAEAAATECCDGYSCASDSCAVVESGMAITLATLKAPIPSLVACICMLCEQLLTPVLPEKCTLAGSDYDRPLDWIQGWQFVRRAAPLSRAPSMIG